MGRDGGSDIEVFDNEDEAKKFIETRKEQNTKNVANYENDSTDSGRGDACENNGGFRRFKVVRYPHTFSCEEEAERCLSDEAMKQDPGDDSIVYVSGEFRVPDKSTTFQKQKESDAFDKALHAKSEVPQVPQGEISLDSLVENSKDDEGQSLTGHGHCDTGASLKRERSLFNDEFVHETKEDVMKEQFKKRKAELESKRTETKTTTKVMVAISWTGAHY